MALDERRRAFRVTRVRRGYEVWFRGVHSDIGGGTNPGLNSIALRWMALKGIRAGLPLDEVHVTAINGQVDPNTNLGVNPDLIRNKPRRVNRTDRVHYTVTSREANGHHNPPAGHAVETENDERNRLQP